MMKIYFVFRILCCTLVYLTHFYLKLTDVARTDFFFSIMNKLLNFVS